MSRLFEPSTWAGIAGILAGIAPVIPPIPLGPVDLHWLFAGAAAAAGSLAVKLRERAA